MSYNKEIIFSNLPEIALEKDNITDKRLPGKWQTVDYECTLTSGTMLMAFSDDKPENVTLRLGLSGRYHIYIGTMIVTVGDNLRVKLSSQPGFTFVKFDRRAAQPTWQPTETMQELYLFTADLDGEDLIIERPDSNSETTSVIAWVKCIPATEEKAYINDFSLPETHTMQYHFDGDITVDALCETVSDACTRHYAVAESDAGIVSQEIFLEQATEEKTDWYAHTVTHGDGVWNRHDKNQFAIKDEVAAERIVLAHKNGYRLYATNRMQVSSFSFPYVHVGWNIDFADTHPEYYIKWRDGSTVKVCSYAYKPVRDYVIGYLTEHLKKGYDGLSLIMHRGVHIGFDEPVLELFSEKYPGVDCRELPLSDERVQTVLCKFMTDFMTELNAAVAKISAEQNRKIGINVISDYTLPTARQFGIDLEEWARLGLITAASQADMEMYEDLTDCMQDGNSALIDLKKYSAENRRRQVVRRNFSTNIEHTLEGVPGYTALEEKYGIEVYNILPWYGSRRPEEYAGVAERLYNAGAKRLFMWNSLQCIQIPAEWNVVKRLGHKKAIEQLKNGEAKFYENYRTLSLDGTDISLFTPNWRG